MTMRERLKISLFCAVFALITGCVTVLFALPRIRVTLIACLVTALLAFLTVLVLNIFVPKKSKAVRIAAFAGAAVVFLVAVFSVLVYNLGNLSLYHPHVDAEETAKLSEIEEYQ